MSDGETSTPAPAPEKTVTVDACGDCGDTAVVACTDGVAAERTCYCIRHKPANLPDNVVR